MHCCRSLEHVRDGVILEIKFARSSQDSGAGRITLVCALIPNRPSAQMSLAALQLATIDGVTALKPSRGARRCAVARAPVSMAGAGKKPKDDDGKPPRGFPRCVPEAPPASVRPPRVAIPAARVTRASRRRPGTTKARRPLETRASRSLGFFFPESTALFRATASSLSRQHGPSTTSLRARRRDAVPLG